MCFVAMQGDGRPINMEACSQFLFVFTDAGRLCMWSLTGREAKPYGGAGRVLDLPPDLLLISMRCNCDGSKVSSLPKAFKPFQSHLECHWLDVTSTEVRRKQVYIDSFVHSWVCQAGLSEALSLCCSKYSQKVQPGNVQLVSADGIQPGLALLSSTAQQHKEWSQVANGCVCPCR